jgi:DNA-binding response OmpR family regulator
MVNIKSILVADKSLKNLNFLCKGLKQQGYKILAASEEKQLIAIAENKLPDLIILSSSLLNYNGANVSDIIKENKFLSNTIIILLVETNEGKWEKLSTEKADILINAPYTLEEIIEKIEALSGLKKN